MVVCYVFSVYLFSVLWCGVVVVVVVVVVEEVGEAGVMQIRAGIRGSNQGCGRCGVRSNQGGDSSGVGFQAVRIRGCVNQGRVCNMNHGGGCKGVRESPCQRELHHVVRGVAELAATLDARL